MNCPEVIDLICRREADLLEGGFPAEAGAHLEACAGCRERALGLGNAVSEMRELLVIEPDADFLSRSWSAIERAPTRPAWEAKVAEPWWARITASFRSFAIIPVGAAAMAALLVLVLRPAPAPRIVVEEVAAATVLEKRGPVTVRGEGDSTVVAVGEAGFARIQHRAGAVVEIAAGSEVEFEMGGVTTVKSGSARYEVAKRAKGETYVTRTWQYDVTVLGTTYDVTVSKEECQVALYEGRIGLSVPEKTELTKFLEPGGSHAGDVPAERPSGVIAAGGEMVPASVEPSAASVVADRSEHPTESPATGDGAAGQQVEPVTGNNLNDVFK